jgi:hypothetical protein
MEYYRLTIPIPKQPWRWIRFRIVTVLLLVAILALGLGWWRDHRQLSMQIYQLEHPDVGWGIDQVTGPPNTTGPGDIRTAWAPATQDDQEEWIVLEYDESVTPVAILVHETYNPGAITKATHFPRFGQEKTLWEGTDPTPPSAGAGVSRLPVSSQVETDHIKLYIDSPSVPGWNEIDAVGIEDSNGDVIWAERAKASSSYGDRTPDNTNPFIFGRGLTR